MVESITVALKQWQYDVNKATSQLFLRNIKGNTYNIDTLIKQRHVDGNRKYERLYLHIQSNFLLVYSIIMQEYQ